GRRAARPRPPSGRAAIRGQRPGGRVRGPAWGVRRRGRGPDAADAGRRADQPGRPGRRPVRTGRLRLPRAEPGGHLPRRVRPRGRGGAPPMTPDVRRRPAVMPPAATSLRNRLFGLGSVYGKAVRDSRRAFVIAVAFLGGFLLMILAAVASLYPTQAARDEIVRLANAVGTAGQGLAGPPVNVGTMGGYVQYKYGPVFLLFAAFWSILALSGTLAGEARRGSLDLVAAVPQSRRRIAVQKVAAHLTLLMVVLVVVALAAWLAGAAFAQLPGDAIPLQAAV